MPTKKCFKCGKIKNLSLFYIHSKMADGHLGKCKSCTNKNVKERYYSPEFRNRIIEYEKKRFQDPERKRKLLIYQQKRREKNVGKFKASYKVNNAIRDGRLKKKPCEVCGSIKSQAHHEDYRKYLDVNWLCFKHHRERHNQIVNL